MANYRPVSLLASFSKVL